MSSSPTKSKSSTTQQFVQRKKLDLVLFAPTSRQKKISHSDQNVVSRNAHASWDHLSRRNNLYKHRNQNLLRASWHAEARGSREIFSSSAPAGSLGSRRNTPASLRTLVDANRRGQSNVAFGGGWSRPRGPSRFRNIEARGGIDTSNRTSRENPLCSNAWQAALHWRKVLEKE